MTMRKNIFVVLLAVTLALVGTGTARATHDDLHTPGAGQECNGLNRANVGDPYCP
jgi:hypothetical protein